MDKSKLRHWSVVTGGKRDRENEEKWGIFITDLAHTWACTGSKLLLHRQKREGGVNLLVGRTFKRRVGRLSNANVKTWKGNRWAILEWKGEISGGKNYNLRGDERRLKKEGIQLVNLPISDAKHDSVTRQGKTQIWLRGRQLKEKKDRSIAGGGKGGSLWVFSLVDTSNRIQVQGGRWDLRRGGVLSISGKTDSTPTKEGKWKWKRENQAKETWFQKISA